MPENTPEEPAEGSVKPTAEVLENRDIPEVTSEVEDSTSVEEPDATEVGIQPLVKKKLNRLLRSVGMGMPGNRVRPFVGKGAIPPVSEKKHFVAKLKALDRIDVAIIEGDYPETDGNDLVGEIGLSNIKLREDGRAEIEIEFHVDKDGFVTVVVTDLLSRVESRGKFLLPQYIGSDSDEDIRTIPVEELSFKLDLLEQQMKMLKGELTARTETEDK